MTPTMQTFNAWQAMFDHFNAELFGGKLPHVLLNMSRKRGAVGFFWAGRWSPAEKGAAIAEISMNPEWLKGRSPEQTASTMVHEMVHLWDHVFGKPGKNGYHGKSWANQMRAVGLEPVSHDQPGKDVGYRCSHNVIADGVFTKAFASLPVKAMPWVCGGAVEKPVDPKEKDRAKAKQKVAYQCECSKAWGKPGLSMTCNECGEDMVEQE